VGEYTIDNVDLFTRNKTGGATISISDGAAVVFGAGVNVTDMTVSTAHTANKRPTLNVDAGGYAYLHTAGFDSYTGAGTIVLDPVLVENGTVNESDFAGFEGRIVYPDGKDIWSTDVVSKLPAVELQDGAVYSITIDSMYVTADDFGVYDNASVILTEDTNDMSQLWRAHKNDDGSYSLENMACGSYLCGVSSNDSIAGTPLSVRASGSADRFKSFSLRSAAGTMSDVVIVNDRTGYVAFVQGTSVTNGLYQALSTQRFTFTKVSDGKGRYPQLLVLSGDYQGSASCPEIFYHNGVYYNYNMTGAITVKTSTDLKHWNVHPDRYAFERPEWLTDVSEEGAIWAPGCYEMNGKYYLYYCTSSSGSRNSAIGVAVSEDPSKNDWKDLGMVLRSYVFDGILSGLSSDFNAIDPNVISDGNGKYYLVYGSYWNGIHMRRLDPDTGMLHKTDTKVYNIARGNPNIEAAYIIKRGGYYYQFVAKGSLSAGTYYWAVGRSQSITGPYYDKDGVDMMNDGGTRLTEYKDGVVGVAHAQYFEDIDGQGYMVSEAWRYRDTEEGNSKIELHISSVVWTEDGWPVTVLDPDVMGKLGEK
jgi:arabinan endo-1,5-alpha-L-arabinosidase